MEAAGDVNPPIAVQRLLERASRVSFIELVYALERLLNPAAPVGGRGPAEAEAVRFKHDPSLSFPTSDVSEARLSTRPGAPARVELTATFLGLTGAASPLPGYIAEEVLQEDPEDPVQRDFLDLFHHRLLGLLYRGVLSRRYPETYLTGGRDIISARLLCLSGADTYDRRCEPPLPRALLLRLAPLLTIHRPTLEALAKAIHLVFDRLTGRAPITIVPLAGGQVPIEPAQRMKLGVNSFLQGERTAPLGSRIRCASARIRIHIGPLSRQAYEALRSHEQVALLRRLVTVVSRQDLDCELVLTLDPNSVLPWHLGRAAATPLGRASWLVSTPTRRTAEVHIELPA